MYTEHITPGPLQPRVETDPMYTKHITPGPLKPRVETEIRRRWPWGCQAATPRCVVCRAHPHATPPHRAHAHATPPRTRARTHLPLGVHVVAVCLLHAARGQHLWLPVAAHQECHDRVWHAAHDNAHGVPAGVREASANRCARARDAAEARVTDRGSAREVKHAHVHVLARGDDLGAVGAPAH
eukprot:365987-Chlamydomonas_euryale.AAC.11